MIISYKWLKDLIEIDLTPDELAEKLTLIGLEIDGMHDHGDDRIFDIEITSNRGDCLSHHGVAREIAAFSGKKIVCKTSLTTEPFTEGDDLVTTNAPELCHRFTARIIRDVKIGESPEWLVTRLESVGERSINNVADITNYVMHELGQPMHSFDLAKLAEARIVVRTANDGETIKTLDEVERKLDQNCLLICDAEKPIAVGGVMGGFDSGITETTTDVLLEVAYFDRDNIRMTSRKLDLSTEASYHFERGVDIDNLIRASNRATELICELAGGTADKFVDTYPTKRTPVEINSPDLKSEIKRLSGLAIDDLEIIRILKALGIEQKDETTFVVPSWRHDLAIEEDLVEEVVRIYGYDNIGEELPRAISIGEYQPTEVRKRRLRSTLADLGFNEAISYSFIDAQFDDVFEYLTDISDIELAGKFVSIKDPIIEGSTRMRPSLLSGLLSSAHTNFNQQNRNVKLFEIGKTFTNSPDNNGLPEEKELLSLLLTGNETFEQSKSSSRELDFYDLKGVLEAGLSVLNLPSLTYKSKNILHLQAGQSSEVLLNDKKIGTIGKLNADLTSRYKFKQSIYVAEIDLQSLLSSPQEPVIYSPLPIYPSITRDVSLLVKGDLTYDNIRTEIERCDSEFFRKVDFVDVFEGKGMKDGERSITVRLEYRSEERTLTEEEVEKVHEEIITPLKTTLAIKQR